MPSLHRTPKTRLLLLGLLPILMLGLGVCVAVMVEYVALGQPNLAYFSLDLVSGCQSQKCQVSLAPKALVEPHTGDRYKQITRLINTVGWHWALSLGPVTLLSEFKYDVPNYEVLVHGGYIDMLGPTVAVAYGTPNQAATARSHSLFTFDNRGK